MLMVTSMAQNESLARKKPQQSRSQVTVLALQDAFVRVLIEQGGLDKVRVRTVVGVAGVGIGTFYDYFPNLQALAASTLVQRSEQLSARLRATTVRFQARPWTEMVHALLDDQIDVILKNPKEIAGLLMIERQVFDLASHQAFHRAFKNNWQDALKLVGVDDPQRLDTMAAMLHAITYGWCAQEILVFRGERDRQQSRDVLGLAVIGYLKTALPA